MPTPGPRPRPPPRRTWTRTRSCPAWSSSAWRWPGRSRPRFPRRPAGRRPGPGLQGRNPLQPPLPRHPPRHRAEGQAAPAAGWSAWRAADQDQDDQLAQAADCRRRVAQGVTGAIAAATAGTTPADIETREQLTADLWDWLAGDHAGRLDTRRQSPANRSPDPQHVPCPRHLAARPRRDRRGHRRRGRGSCQIQGGDRRPCARAGLVSLREIHLVPSRPPPRPPGRESG